MNRSRNQFFRSTFHGCTLYSQKGLDFVSQFMQIGCGFQQTRDHRVPKRCNRDALVGRVPGDAPEVDLVDVARVEEPGAVQRVVEAVADDKAPGHTGERIEDEDAIRNDEK